MTMDKAIKDLRTLHKLLTGGTDASFLDAIKLGEEALRECKRAREGNPALDGELLPGETED